MPYQKTGASKILKRPISSELMEHELNRVIQEIVAVILEEERENDRAIRRLQGLQDTLEKLAALTECKIKKQVLTQIKERVRKILRRSANKLLVAAMGDN